MSEVRQINSVSRKVDHSRLWGCNATHSTFTVTRRCSHSDRRPLVYMSKTLPRRDSSTLLLAPDAFPAGRLGI